MGVRVPRVSPAARGGGSAPPMACCGPAGGVAVGPSGVGPPPPLLAGGRGAVASEEGLGRRRGFGYTFCLRGTLVVWAKSVSALS